MGYQIFQYAKVKHWYTQIISKEIKQPNIVQTKRKKIITRNKNKW